MLYLFLGVLGIGIRLNIAKKNLLTGALGGLFSMIVLTFLTNYIPQSATVFFTAFSASVFSEIMARIRKTPVTVFLPLSIIPILPGKDVYDAITLVLHQNVNQFIENIISVFYTTMSIATAIITVRAIDVIFSKIKNLFSNRS